MTSNNIERTRILESISRLFILKLLVNEYILYIKELVSIKFNSKKLFNNNKLKINLNLKNNSNKIIFCFNNFIKLKKFILLGFYF